MNKNSKYFVTFALFIAVAQIIPHSLNAQIDTSDRWIVRDFYNFVYFYGVDFPMEWTGDYTNTNTLPGTVGSDWLEASRIRINFYRHMAGMQPNITFDSALNAASQQSALIISASGVLTHFPPDTYAFWTQAGYDAASKGNIAIGTVGLNAMDGFMVDKGASNAKVGHRRWFLYPQADVMGSGDVPGDDSTYWPANTVWVQPANPWSPRPTLRDGDIFVAWPPKGHVPSNIVWSRWSFSYPNADFGSATVTMTGPGGSIPLTYDYRTTGSEVNSAPESVLVWVPNGMDTNARVEWPTPTIDEPIDVSITGVTVSGQPVGPFNYTVTIIDPDSPGNAEFDTTLSAPASVPVNSPVMFTVASRSWSEGVQGRSFQTQAANDFDAESGIGSIIEQTSGDYSTIVSGRSGNGTNVYHLAHSFPDPQILTLPGSYLVGSNTPQISFSSSLAWATDIQFASVDVKVGDQNDWKSIWTTSGPKGSESSFTQVGPIDLGEWSGLTIQIRFRYDLEIGSYYPSSGTNDGWAFDDITLTDLELVTGLNELPVAMGSDKVTVTFNDTSTTYLQARDIAFTEMDPNGFALDWGPALEVTPSGEAGWTLAGTAIGTWTNHETVGWIYGANSDWIYSFAMGWVYVQQGSWLYTGTGWALYIQGNVTDGMWLYSPDEGFIYVSMSHPGQYLRDPFTGEPQTWGSFLP